MPGQTYPFILQAGEQKSIGPIGFNPKSIGVDTIAANFFVHFPDGGFGAWVNPYVTGAIVPAPGINQNIRVSAVDTPSGKAAASAAMGAAYCLVFEDFQSPSPGIPSALAASGICFATASRNPGTYTFIPPVVQGYHGIVLFLNVTGGTGTVTITVYIQDSQAGGTGAANPELQSTAIGPAPAGWRGELYPGIQVVANTSASGVIIPYLNIQAVVATAAATFELTYYLIP